MKRPRSRLFEGMPGRDADRLAERLAIGAGVARRQFSQTRSTRARSGVRRADQEVAAGAGRVGLVRKPKAV